MRRLRITSASCDQEIFFLTDNKKLIIYGVCTPYRFGRTSRFNNTKGVFYPERWFCAILQNCETYGERYFSWSTARVNMYFIGNNLDLPIVNDIYRKRKLQEHISRCTCFAISSYYIITCCIKPHCTCPIPHNAPFRTEMYTFLFRIVHYGIWNRCIVGFVRLIFYIWCNWCWSSLVQVMAC